MVVEGAAAGLGDGEDDVDASMPVGGEGPQLFEGQSLQQTRAEVSRAPPQLEGSHQVSHSEALHRLPHATM